MNYRYRVKAKAKKAFILRGMHYGIGSQIDRAVTDCELTFVKERCEICEIIDTENIVSKPNSVSVNTNITKKVENRHSGSKNEPTNRTTKGKSKETMRTPKTVGN